MYTLAFILSDKLLAVTALLPAAGVIAYGAFGSVSDKPHPTPELQEYVDRNYRLSYADGQKAMFRTDYGASLVLIGSELGAAGTVTEITKKAHGWVVATNKGYIFTVSR